MPTRELKPDQFSSYPPEARKLALANLRALQSLPLSLLPSLLRELIEYDYKFPAERSSLEREISNFNSLTPEQWKEWFGAFERIQLSAPLERFDWINQPAQFVEQLSAHLWTTHQQDDFRKAATEYGNRLHAAVPPLEPSISRLSIVVVGQGVVASDYPVFRKLRPQGALYTNVNPEGGLDTLLEFVASRAKAHPAKYGHWYVDGGQERPCDSSVACISYRALEPARNQLLARIRKQSDMPGSGPENLRTVMAALRPADIHLEHFGDAVLARFELKLLTEGSGTQIFSTTFAQWAVREALRRAQPVTLLVRFAPRQRQRPMNEMLADTKETVELDPAGSLVDADLGAYYTWLNQQRLTGAGQSSFLAWFEGHNVAIATGPAVPRGTVSNSPADLKQILSWTI
jgi:hypothetical protein